MNKNDITKEVATDRTHVIQSKQKNQIKNKLGLQNQISEGAEPIQEDVIVASAGAESLGAIPETVSESIGSAVELPAAASDVAAVSQASAVSVGSNVLAPVAAVTTVGVASSGGSNSSGSQPQPETKPKPKAPVIHDVTGDNIINRSEFAELVFDGLKDAGGYVVITIGGRTNILQPDNGTSWSYALTPEDIALLQDGEHTFSVVQVDGAGNASQATLHKVTVDTVAPTAPLLELQADTGTSTSDSITNDGTVKVTLKESGGTWQYSTDSGLTWSPPQEDTVKSFTLSAGTYQANSIQVRQTDLAGNISPVGKIASSVLVDTVAPTEAVITPDVDTGENATDGITSNKTIVVQTDVDSTWMYQVGDQIDDSKWIVATGNSFEMQQGEHKYHIKQADPAGNETTNHRTLRLDTDKPQFTDSQTIKTTALEGESNSIYIADATDATEIRYSIDGEDKAAFEVNPVTGEVTVENLDYEKYGDKDRDNIYKVTLKATDLAGNFSTKDLEVEITNKGEAGDAVIDLGEGKGQLICGVQVEGKWYYVWDPDKSGDLGYGPSLFNPNGTDDRRHMSDITKALGITGVTENNSEFTINGVRLKLPVAGVPLDEMNRRHMNGTTWSIDTPGADTGATPNVKYDDLLAIWDAYNGTGTATTTGNFTNPAGWADAYYWTANAYSSGGYGFVGMNGEVGVDGGKNFIAFQVL